MMHVLFAIVSCFYRANNLTAQTTVSYWRRSIVVRTLVLAGELSLSGTRLLAG